jgi:hypothetical protein
MKCSWADSLILRCDDFPAFQGLSLKEEEKRKMKKMRGPPGFLVCP